MPSYPKGARQILAKPHRAFSTIALKKQAFFGLRRPRFGSTAGKSGYQHLTA